MKNTECPKFPNKTYNKSVAKIIKLSIVTFGYILNVTQQMLQDICYKMMKPNGSVLNVPMEFSNFLSLKNLIFSPQLNQKS